MKHEFYTAIELFFFLEAHGPVTSQLGGLDTGSYKSVSYSSCQVGLLRAKNFISILTVVMTGYDSCTIFAPLGL